MTAPPPDPATAQTSPFTLRQAATCGLLALFLDVAISTYHLHAVGAGELLNPDSYMRLVRLHDILAVHSPIDAVARDSSGAGTVLHWSHLLDSLLVLAATPLMPFLGQAEAIRWAGILLGPIGAGCLGMAVAWAAAPLTDPDWRWTAAVVALLSAPVVGYALPGIVHHHILAALSAVMCAGWAGRAGYLGATAGIGLGAWAAFGLWLTPEVMPVSLLAFFAVGTGWLVAPPGSRWGPALAAATAAFAVATALALSADPPGGNPFSVELDRLSIAWLAFALLAATAGCCLYVLDRFTLSAPLRASIGLASVALAAGTWLALFPAILGGPEGVMNGARPEVFAGIAEMQPISSFRDAALYLLIGIFGFAVAATLAVSRRSWLFAYTAAAIVLLLLMGLLHRRFAAYQACAGAAAVPVAVTLISLGLAEKPPLWGIVARLSVLLFLFIAPFAAYRLASAVSPPEPSTVEACDPRLAAPMLQPFAGQTVLADVNMTPELLYWSGLRTVGSLYHRGVQGYVRLRTAWRSTGTERVPAAVAATGATLVLFCRAAGRSFLVGDLPPGTLWDQLASGKPPTWLRQVAEDAKSGFTLYRISVPASTP